MSSIDDHTRICVRVQSFIHSVCLCFQLSERMQQLSQIEVDLETKKRKVIDKAIEMQEEAVMRFLSFRRSSDVGIGEPPISPEAAAAMSAGVAQDETSLDDPPAHANDDLADEETDAGDADSRNSLEEMRDSSVAKTKAAGSAGAGAKLTPTPAGGWPEMSREQRQVLRQSRDKPWMARATSTRSIKTSLRQAVSDSRAGDAALESPTAASTRPSSASTSVSTRTDIGEAASDSASAASAASAALTQIKRIRPTKEREKPWRLGAKVQPAKQDWTKLRSAVHEGKVEQASDAIDPRPCSVEGSVSDAGSLPAKSATSESDFETQAGQDSSEEIHQASAIEFPDIWHSSENTLWSSWVRGILYGEKTQSPAPSNEASKVVVQATVEDLWAHEIQMVRPVAWCFAVGRCLYA